jgi:2-polyprenyl-3-methyl-5-hydroxy-6-metoxy-1,4-benzoquinol methylase
MSSRPITRTRLCAGRRRNARRPRALRRAGLRIEDLTGVGYDPLRDRFRLSRDAAVDYMLFATRS